MSDDERSIVDAGRGHLLAGPYSAAQPYSKERQTWSRQKGSRTGAVLTCKHCGAELYVVPSRMRSTIKPAYCSLQCVGKARKDPDTYAAQRRVFNLAAKGEHECRVCGSREHVHAHHAIPTAIGTPESRLDLRNLLPLCWHCHRYWHAGRPISRDVFTADEWVYLRSVELQGRDVAGYLDKHYPAGPVPDFHSVCVNGHEYEPINFYVDARGKRHCRLCERAAWYERTGRPEVANEIRAAQRG